MRIAVDAFGGDFAPVATVNGALLAAKEAKNNHDHITISLFGTQDDLQSVSEELDDPAIEFFDVSSFESDGIHNTTAPRNSKLSLIRNAVKLHRLGRCDAVVSAGPTGLLVRASLDELEICHGITRPAVGTFVPTSTGCSFLLDIGASLTANAHHLLQFAAMGHVYVREILGITEPRIGILNIAREETVGDRTTVEAYRLLGESIFNFIGFVEGRDISRGIADVIVTNGFVGNVLLKYAEGIPKFIKSQLPRDADPKIWNALYEKLDYQRFGGEPLLGVKGVSIICHGSSSEKGIASAISQASKMVKNELHRKIESFLVDSSLSISRKFCN